MNSPLLGSNYNYLKPKYQHNQISSPFKFNFFGPINSIVHTTPSSNLYLSL